MGSQISWFFMIFPWFFLFKIGKIHGYLGLSRIFRQEKMGEDDSAILADTSSLLHQVYSQGFDEHPVNLPFPHDNLEKAITKHNSQWLAQAFCIPKCVSSANVQLLHVQVIWFLWDDIRLNWSSHWANRSPQASHLGNRDSRPIPFDDVDPRLWKSTHGNNLDVVE